MPRILVAEADPVFAAEIKHALTGRAREVIVTADGGAVPGLAAQHGVDCIVLRVELPGKNGYSVCTELKKHAQLKQIPIVISSSAGSPEIFEKHSNLRTRADAYLVQPFPMETLLATVSQFVQLREADAILIDSDAGLIDAGAGEFEIEVTDDDGYGFATSGPFDVDPDVEEETDLAFAALEMEDGARESAPPVTIRAKAPVPEVDSEDDAAFAAELSTEVGADLILLAGSEPPPSPRDPDTFVAGPLPEASMGQLTNEAGIKTAVSSDLGIVDPPVASVTTAEAPPEEVLIDASRAGPLDAAVYAPRTIETEGEVSRLDGGISLDQAVEILSSELDAEDEVLIATVGAGELIEDFDEPGISHSFVPGRGTDEDQALGAGSTDEVSEALAQQVAGLERRLAGLDQQLETAEAKSAASEQRAALLEQQLDEAEQRVREREAEAQEAKTRANRAEARANELEVSASTAAAESGGAFSRDRELLNLREIINRKEKEILDHKDDLMAKDRQILDHRDKVRELERKARDADDRLLATERELVGARERVEALSRDKERVLEREQALKQRLEEMKAEVAKSHAENVEVRQRQEQHLAEFKDEIAREREAMVATHAAEMSAAAEAAEARQWELQQEAARAAEAAAQQAAAARTELEQRLEAESQDTIAELGQQHQAELERQSQESAAALAQAVEQHEEEQASAAAAHQAALEALRAAHAREQEEAESARRAAIDEIVGVHAGELAAHRERHEAALRDQQQRFDEQREQQNQRHAEFTAELEGEKEALRTAHKAELQRLQAEQQQTLEAERSAHQRAVEVLQAEQAESGKAHAEREAELEGHAEALKKHYEAELARTEDERKAEVADWGSRFEAAETAHVSRVEALESAAESAAAAHRQRVAQLEARAEEDAASHAARVAELEASAVAAAEAHAARSAELEQRLSEAAERQEALEASLEERDRSISALKGDVQNAQELGAAQLQKIGELEGRLSDEHAQLMRAYAKLQTDEALTDKAKRALSIALTLLEEQGKGSEVPAGLGDGREAEEHLDAARS